FNPCSLSAIPLRAGPTERGRSLSGLPDGPVRRVSRSLARTQGVTMLSVTVLSLVCALAPAESTWQTNYDKAIAQAVKEHKDLVIHFREDSTLDEPLENPAVKKRLANFVCLRLPADFKFKGERLLDHEALVEMMGKPGLVVASYHDEKLP